MEKKTNAHKHCYVCGQEVGESWNYCSNCGRVLPLSVIKRIGEADKSEEIHVLTIDELPGPFCSFAMSEF